MILIHIREKVDQNLSKTQYILRQCLVKMLVIAIFYYQDPHAARGDY